uniref:Uncharacterized protein n=1 Tax=viral metagenome TaxID=1070528 RepID=A0A6M3KSR4_9ZZZZ
MFIKIKYSDVEKKEGMIVQNTFVAEHIYDCNHFTLFPTKPKLPEEPELEMNVSLEFNKSGPEGWDRTISFPCESDTQVVEIFIMNEHGKTIDRYIY